MKTSLLLSLALSLILASCGVIGTEQFGKQKYTNYKRGNGSTVKYENVLHKKAEKIAPVQKDRNSTVIEPKEISGTGITPVVGQPDHSSVVTTNTNTTSIAPKIDRSQKPMSFRLMGKGASSAADGGCNSVLMVLLCIFLPPLAIYLVESTSTRFWIALICCVLGGGGAFAYYYFGGLWLVAIILAFLAYFGN